MSMSLVELREKTIPQLREALKALRKQYNLLVIAKENNAEFKQTHRFRVLRREIAQLNTLMSEKTKKGDLL